MNKKIALSSLATRHELEKHSPFACVVTLSLAVKTGFYSGQAVEFIPPYMPLHNNEFCTLEMLSVNYQNF
jgi:hypothetical protein